MSKGLEDIKRVVILRSDAQSACTFRIIGAVVLAPTICTSVYMALKEILNIGAGSTGWMELLTVIWTFGGIPIVIAAAAWYICRTLVRRWSYSFMLDYQEDLAANGYTKCPRCGHKVVPRTGQYSYREHTSDTVTTTSWSDGSTTTSRSPNYTSKSVNYRYFQCSNPTCAIMVGHRSLGKIRYRGMPATVKGARALILGGGSGKGKVAVPASKLISSKSLIFIVAVILVVFAVVRVIQYNSLENAGDSVLFDAPDIADDVGLAALDAVQGDAALPAYTISVHPRVGMFSFIFMQGKPCTVKKATTDGTTVYQFDFSEYDAETGLDDRLYLVQENGGSSIYDDRTDGFYTEGTAAYNAVFPLLSSLTCDGLIDRELFHRTDSLAELRCTQTGTSFGFDCDYKETDDGYSYYEWLVATDGRAAFIRRNTPQEDFRCCLFDYGTPEIKPIDKTDYTAMDTLPERYQAGA